MAVVERFKQEVKYRLSAGTKKSDRCREVAFVERWPLEEVGLFLSLQVFRYKFFSCFPCKPNFE